MEQGSEDRIENTIFVFPALSHSQGKVVFPQE